MSSESIQRPSKLKSSFGTRIRTSSRSVQSPYRLALSSGSAPYAETALRSSLRDRTGQRRDRNDFSIWVVGGTNVMSDNDSARGPAAASKPRNWEERLRWGFIYTDLPSRCGGRPEAAWIIGIVCL